MRRMTDRSRAIESLPRAESDTGDGAPLVDRSKDIVDTFLGRITGAALIDASSLGGGLVVHIPEYHD